MIKSVDNNFTSDQNISDIPAHLQWLKVEAPGFSVHGNQVSVVGLILVQI